MNLMKYIVFIILATFLDLKAVNCYSSSSSNSISGSSSSSSNSDYNPSSGPSEKDITQNVQTQESEKNSPHPVALTAPERKKIWDREYVRKKREANPNFSRDQARKYREMHENDLEWKAKRRATNQAYKERTREYRRMKDKEYRIRNREAITRRQREARALKKKILLKGSESVVGTTTKKRKNQEAFLESNHKRIRVGAAQPNTGTTSNSQGTRPPQSQGRNIIRLKLSQDTIRKFYHNPPPSSPKQ